MPEPRAPEFDVVLYGATGFTGRQCVADFAQHAQGLRWAIAGRSQARLEALAAAHGAPAVLLADSSDPLSLRALAARTRVVLTTAGPYARYGDPVVEACVATGAHYCDITGETAWVRGLIDRHHAAAAARGTRLVPFCGFDSVPADQGTLALVEALRARGAGTRSVRAAYMGKGGFNGGTLDSALTMGERGDHQGMADAFFLNPKDARPPYDRARHGDRRRISYDPVLKTWQVPFLMEVVNTRVVRRSAALAGLEGRAYGEDFAYTEAMETRSRASAYGVAAGLGVLEKLIARPLGRAVLRRLGPKPGEGPSEETMVEGFTRVRYVAEGDDGQVLRAELRYGGDPGNRFTVLCLCEAARMLAGDEAQLPGGAQRGGVLTPAMALGLGLLDRLQARGVAWSLSG